MLRFGVYCANYGRLGDARLLVDLGLRAEAAGWDGFFVYDHILIDPRRAVPSADPWTVLGALAGLTRLWLGTLVTPLARRTPWEVAHQAIVLDRLTGGRFVLGAGLGEPGDHEPFGDNRSPRERAAALDEALTLIRRLWAGEAVSHEGAWTLRDVQLAPRPVNGTIPIWVAGRYPNARPMRRAAGQDGMFPIDRAWDVHAPLSADRLAHMVGLARAAGAPMEGFEVVTAGVTPADQGAARAILDVYAAVGATWWLETIEPRRGATADLIARIDAGPPPITG